jgi:hypothetical protein
MAREMYDRFLEAAAQGLKRRRRFRKTLPDVVPYGVYHLFGLGSTPAAGSYPGSDLAAQSILGGDAPSVTGGYLNFKDPTSPKQNFLSFAKAKGKTSGLSGTLYFLDLLATYKGFDANSAIAQPTTGSAAGTSFVPRYTTGLGTVIFADVTTALGAGAANLTVTYTKGDLTSARTTQSTAMIPSAAVGRVPHAPLFLPLQAGDDEASGPVSIQSATLSAGMGSGVFSLCIARLLGQVDIDDETDFVTAPPFPEEILDNCALTMLFEAASTTTAPTLDGFVEACELDPDEA